MIALNKLFNIAEYFNLKQNKTEYYYYIYKTKDGKYYTTTKIYTLCGMPKFNNEEDANFVIENFQTILDKIFI